jgi:hypothetical protein
MRSRSYPPYNTSFAWSRIPGDQTFELFAELRSRRSIGQRPPSSDHSVESNFICAGICADRT